MPDRLFGEDGIDLANGLRSARVRARAHDPLHGLDARIATPMDMRVHPTSTSSMVTRVVAGGMSVFGLASAFASPSRKTSRCGASASRISQ